jgi:hypothetical protein
MSDFKVKFQCRSYFPHLAPAGRRKQCICPCSTAKRPLFFLNVCRCYMIERRACMSLITAFKRAGASSDKSLHNPRLFQVKVMRSGGIYILDGNRSIISPPKISHSKNNSCSACCAVSITAHLEAGLRVEFPSYSSAYIDARCPFALVCLFAYKRESIRIRVMLHSHQASLRDVQTVGMLKARPEK